MRVPLDEKSAEVSERVGHAETSFTHDTYVGKRIDKTKAAPAWGRRLKALAVG